MAVRTVHEEIADVLKGNQQTILNLWMEQLKTRAKGLVSAVGETRMKSYISSNLNALIDAIPTGDDIESKPYTGIREIHEKLCDELVAKGAKAAEIPLYVFSKRDAIQSVLLKSYPDKVKLNEAVSIANKVVENLGLYIIDYYVQSRESQVKASSQYARSLIEASLDPLVTISPEGKITDVNEATVKVTGISRKELIGTDFLDYFTEPEKAREGYQEVFQKGFVTDYPLTIRHKGGKLTDVLYNAAVYKNEAGNVLGVFAAARDVTVQKRASQYVRSLIEASLDPLVTIGSDGKITDVNSATEMVTGCTRKELVGTDFSDYFTEPDKARAGYQQVFREGSVRDYALEIKHKDGHLTPVLYNASVYKDESGNVMGVFAAARDITEQRKTTEMLKEQQKAFLEVSVPVVNLWNRILLLPLIGVFDSKRAQQVLETLLATIEKSQPKVVLLDISGIPIMDTLVAKYLLRIISASRLMGTECIITGIRSSISQTIVHLGVDLTGVITKTTLDEGLRLAFMMTEMKVVPLKPGEN